MIFYDQIRHNTEKKDVHDAECPERDIRRTKRLRRHQNNANPHADRPAQAEIFGAFRPPKLHYKRNVEQRKRYSGHHSDLFNAENTRYVSQCPNRLLSPKFGLKSTFQFGPHPLLEALYFLIRKSA